MENRGRKRSESADQLPSDKRACSSSSELKPGSSNSSLQTHMGSNNSVSEQQDCEMEASSSASISGRSDGGDTEKDSSTYGSCDSDGVDESEQKQRIYHEYNPRRVSGDQEKFKRILTNLTDENTGESDQLAALTQLCDVLSFCTDSSISSYTADSLSPVLVRLANHETNSDIMLFAIRAITYLCDVLPRASAFLVRHDAVHALCARLLDIGDLDVAEQCLLALEKISLDQPLACLQAGAVMAVLSFIDFFSSSVQRVAINTVANICKKLPADGSSHFMGAVPDLCKLLRYEDQKNVENIATCLIRMAESVSHSSEMVDQLCKHGLIHQVIPLIALNSQTSLSQSTYARLIGLLSRLASGSVAVVGTLLELNISSTLKNILSSYDISHSTSSVLMGGDVNSNQVHEVLKLLNVLLPPLGGKREDNLVLSDKEKILKDQPELLRRFGLDILPVLIQVVNGGANLHVCYGCVSVINKLVYVSRSDMLFDLLKNTNISSFLAGVFARKDHHVLISALNIVETILQELPEFYLNSFMKEGVVYAIDAILTPERFSHFMFPSSSGSQLSSSSHQKLNSKDAVRCLCYNLNIGQPRSSEIGTCKLEKDCVQTLAMCIKATYFATETNNSEIGLTETLQKLRNFGAVLNDMVNLSMNSDISAEQEENLFHILRQIMMELSGGESVSTFEFIESGIVRSLLNYFSNGQYLKGKVDHDLLDYSLVVLKRFAVFASFSLSSMSLHWEGMPLTVLVRKLQIALSSLENFPVILNQISKPRNTYAAIPTGHFTMHPCLRVRFVKEEGETTLCDYSADIVSIEPFTSLDAIERFLWPKVGTSRDEHQITSAGKCTGLSEDIALPLPSDARSPKGKDPSPMEVNHNMPDNLPGMQDFAEAELQFLAAVNATLKTQNSANASTSCSASTSEQCPGSRSNEDTSQKLIFCLDGRQLDQTLTLYQAILQLQVKEEHDMVAGRRFWSEVYEVTYRKEAESVQSNPQDSSNGTQSSTYPRKTCQNVLCFSSMLTAEHPYNLEKSDPVYEILFLLKNLEVINKSLFHLISHERVKAFAEGKSDDLDSLAIKVCPVPHTEFVSSKLTEKLEQQLGDPLAVSVGAMPSWCSQLIGECPFLFSFEARCKYFLLTAFGSSRFQPHPSPISANNNLSPTSDRRSPVGSFPRKKFQVNRSHILDSAARMMDLHAHQKVTLEVEYSEEVGTGLGPTMEFYTLVSHEFQKVGLGMWREDRSFPNSGKDEEPGFVVAPSGLFPRPWSASMGTSNGIHFSEVIKKFSLLGKVVAKALQDGRVLDLPLSKAFYKLLLDQELNIYDIQSIDPGLGRVLLEFQALVERISIAGNSSTFVPASCFRNTKIEDLCLDFTLPGYPDYILASEQVRKMVNMSNLEEYVSLIVDSTVNCGISRQVEAFKSGFNKVFPIKSLKIFTEEEIERLLCGERDAWTSTELLDHIKFDHGYTVSSPPIIYLLEIIKEFDREQQQAFVQFVTGAPHLPHGGLAALNPKMTIVRKHSNEWADGDLPSVMTCANYLKLPSYSSKDIMKERLLYAITEGQGSFHLS